MRYEDMEYVNSQHILETIEEGGEKPTRSVIAHELGLSRAAVSILTSDLISLKLVEEDGTPAKPDGRGRPGNPLRLDCSYWKVLGASLQSDGWQVVVTDLSGKILDVVSFPLDAVTPDCMIDTLVSGLKAMLEKWNGHPFLPGVGVGVPGVVDTSTGTIEFAYDFGWDSPVGIAGPVGNALGMSVFVQNRYILEGIAEYKYANPEKVKDMVYIGIGSGIRSAIFVDGRLVKGSIFSAGRLSHIQVEEQGRLCTCGRHGCLYTVANDSALQEWYSSFLGAGDSARLSALAVTALADVGYPAACQAVDKVASFVLKAVLIISDVLNPRLMVFGGPVGDCHRLVSSLARGIAENKAKNPYMNLNVRRCSIKRYGSARGAASLVIEKKLQLLRDGR